MISPASFVDFLASHGIRHYTGVPCSYFKSIICYLEHQDSYPYYIAPNEGSSLAFASGLYMGGKKCAVMIQNSGLGNMINPLTSLNAIYDIPVPVFVSGRAYKIDDEPQHEIMGRNMSEMLKALELKTYEMPTSEKDAFKVLKEGFEYMRASRKPALFLVQKNTFESFEGPQRKKVFEMKRSEAIRMICESVQANDLVFSTTGKPSREHFSLGDRAGNFYMQGSMGHIGAVALGVALAVPNQRVIIIDGDGAFMMHMGNAAMIGHYKASNLVHIVLDNEAYETTGDQNTTSATADFKKIAESVGYSSCSETAVKQEFQTFLDSLKSDMNGPLFIRVKINREETKDIPRITTKYKAPQITDLLMKGVNRDAVSEERS